MGLLVGLIVGMSVSPVVSVILGALAALLAAFLGLQPGSPEATSTFSRLQQNGLKAGSFGFACVAGIVLGLFIRTNDVFSPPLTRQLNDWKKAGYSEDYARELIVFRKIGIKPNSKDIQITDIQKGQTNALFSGKSQTDLCFELSPDRYGNEVDKILSAYRNQELPALTRLADRIEAMDASVSQKQALLTAISEVICEQQ
ncbi:MAG: hypothetical protein D6814_09235 [Calditrichaeota bacterium]|nr:MAG: hypothetical protein D6814_09235 [Calditrichota bacterium]